MAGFIQFRTLMVSLKLYCLNIPVVREYFIYSHTPVFTGHFTFIRQLRFWRDFEVGQHLFRVIPQHDKTTVVLEYYKQSAPK